MLLKGSECADLVLKSLELHIHLTPALGSAQARLLRICVIFATKSCGKAWAPRTESTGH